MELHASRRSFLGTAMGTALSGLVASSGLAASLAHPAAAQTTLSPEDALQALLDGNRRFTSGQLTAQEKDIAILREKTAEKQEPFAAVLSCADSRVPVELIFDQSIGHVFVARVAGNIVTAEIIASLEYAAIVLGTRIMLVMGHAGCGAVKATIQAKPVPGVISALYSHIQPAVNQAGPDLEAATKANARIQALLLRQASTVIGGLVKESKLKVVAAYYEIGSGAVTLLE